MIAAWLDKLRQDRSPGCHLGTLLESEAARRFFAQCGFVQIGEPALVPGMRYRGRHCIRSSLRGNSKRGDLEQWRGQGLAIPVCRSADISSISQSRNALTFLCRSAPFG